MDLGFAEQVIATAARRGLVGVEALDPPLEIVQVGRTSVASVDLAIPTYRIASYPLDGANLDDIASEAARSTERCQYCRQGIDRINRVVLEEGSWTGADIFSARGLPGTILVTDRFKAMLDEEGFSNGTLIPAEEYRINFDEALEGLDYLAGLMDSEVH